MSDIVKALDEVLEWIVGAQDTVETRARSLLVKGPNFVIVARGAAGAVIFDAQGKVEVRTGHATVVDTVNAGVLARLSQVAQDAQLIPDALMRMTAQDWGPHCSAVRRSRCRVRGRAHLGPTSLVAGGSLSETGLSADRQSLR